MQYPERMEYVPEETSSISTQISRQTELRKPHCWNTGPYHMRTLATGPMTLKYTPHVLIIWGLSVPLASV